MVEAQPHEGPSRTSLASRLWTQDRAAAEQFQLSHIQWEGKDGLGKRGLRVNGNSGAGAINLAYHFGARRILLVGMDMKPGPNGEKHWHPDHPKPLVQGQQFEEWRKKMGVLAVDLKTEGVTVVNCTPGRRSRASRWAIWSRSLK